MNLDGKFIVFEGLDGSGKTSQLAATFKWLRTQIDTPIFTVREPGSTLIGEQVRHILKTYRGTPETELMLYSAARAQLVEKWLRPAIAEGKVVLCDRYIYSTYAYQCRARGLPFREVRTITEFATDGLKPDLIFYLDVDYEEACRRMGHRKLDRFDRESAMFHAEVRKGYAQMIENMSATKPNLWEVIYTTNNTFHETQIEIRDRLKERFG